MPRLAPASLALLTLCAFDASHVAAAPRRFALDSAAGLKLVNTRAAVETYRGRKAVRLKPLEGHERGDESMLALVTGTDFHDGTLELEVAGTASPGSEPGMRGFLGLAFRVQTAGEQARFECIYLRTLNARSEDQLQRNHSVQYVSSPDWGWKRLRDQSPGQYESYVDLEPGAWTKLQIVVSGTTARLFVHGGSQPVLVVHDLKLGDTHGAIALWSHESTDGYFSGLVVR
jgi:hypothetical protein